VVAVDRSPVLVTVLMVVLAVALVVVTFWAVLEQQIKVTQAVMQTTQQPLLLHQVAVAALVLLVLMPFLLAELLELRVRAVRAFQIL
jgi:glucan phosphoethanolaminetransferase (alkaline phosphatase superfamily)